jgi:multifunctional methyltransferase subunit TRM112
MRLLTHNFLKCVTKDCTGKDSFPLQLAATQVERDEECDFVLEAAQKLLSRVDLAALQSGVSQLGLMDQIDGDVHVEGLVKTAFELLMGVHIIEGVMTCPNCARKYPINQGIPNMLLREDEV